MSSSLELWSAFVAATAIFAFFPGPALLYTAAQTLARGKRGGLFAAAGIHLGGYAHVLGATLGLSAVFQHVPEAYLALKIFGAAYLVFLGVEMLRRRPGGVVPRLQRTSARRAFGESVVVELLNPKVTIFFIAFLPQFADPSAAWPIWAQLLVLGVIVNIAFSSADIMTVFLTERVVRLTKASGWGERAARSVAGSVLIGLGAHLALSRAQ